MGGVCAKRGRRRRSSSRATRNDECRTTILGNNEPENKRVVRIADSAPEGGAQESQRTPDNSQSAPNYPEVASRNDERPSTARGDNEEILEPEFQAMLKQFTRKSLSSEGFETKRRMSSSTRGKRRDSRIDDKDVLKLIASKSRKDMAEIQNIANLKNQISNDEEAIDAIDIEAVKTEAPDLAERVQRRRQTMEKLDIFSPDAAPDRLEELYEATEKLIAKEDEDRARGK